MTRVERPLEYFVSAWPQVSPRERSRTKQIDCQGNAKHLGFETHDGPLGFRGRLSTRGKFYEFPRRNRRSGATRLKITFVIDDRSVETSTIPEQRVFEGGRVGTAKNFRRNRAFIATLLKQQIANSDLLENSLCQASAERRLAVHPTFETRNDIEWNADDKRQRNKRDIFDETPSLSLYSASRITILFNFLWRGEFQPLYQAIQFTPPSSSSCFQSYDATSSLRTSP